MFCQKLFAYKFSAKLSASASEGWNLSGGSPRVTYINMLVQNCVIMR